MNNYTDKYSRIHTKPVTDINPIPTNNGWIYSAYYQKSGGTLDRSQLVECENLCFKVRKDFNAYYIRSPEKDLPPMSRDEILGLSGLGLLAYKNWDFSPYPIPAFSLPKLLSQLWEVKGKHRNYFWENSLDQLYRFAFSVPLQDRYYILQKWGKYKWYNPAHLFYAGISSIDRLGRASGIRYLKYGGEKNRLAMLTEFPEDHPIRKL